MGLGVSLSIRSALGTTPISSVPYVLSLVETRLSVGTFTILMNALFILAQWLLLRDEFRWRHLLQLPAVMLYGLFTDVNLWITSGLAPEHYGAKLTLSLVSCVVMAVGIFLTVRSEVTCMPGEGITLAITRKYNLPFGKTKTAVDTTLTLLAVLLAFTFLGRLVGVREGTVLSAMLVGSITGVLQRHAGFIDRLLQEERTTVTTVATEVESPIKSYPVITIAREYGSGGHEIGVRLARKLGVTLYDSELIDLTAEESGFTKEYVAKNEQRLTHNLFDQLYRDNYAYVNELEPPEDVLFMVQSKVIRGLAQGPCVIVGRAANYILKGHPGLYSVFVHSDKDFRIQRAIECYGISPNEAPELVQRKDKERANYSRYYTGRAWADTHNYDLTISSETHGVDGCVELILEGLAQRQ